MTDLNKAIAFIENRGNQVELARLHYLLTNERPSQEVISELFNGQRLDGGWPPYWAEDYTSLDASCFRLAQADQLGISPSETAVRATVHFLAQRQSSDGSWEEDKRIAHLAPVWALPGDLAAKLYITANCGLWLSLLGNPDDKGLKAANYLRSQFNQAGSLPSFLHTHWLAGGLLYKMNYRDESGKAFDYLSRRADDLAVSNLSWLMITLVSAGVPANLPLLKKAALLLDRGQQDDGRWPSEDGPSQDVHSTLEALRALWLYGQSSNQ
ncbi:MAG TPA: prenyltransferase/squalene oxidase repeat-containing protein [Terriglobia bacterium]|nr:prenyltransferase/squalene oxidase repeat-containing protein [Terriglobia bacterium]